MFPKMTPLRSPPTVSTVYVQPDDYQGSNKKIFNNLIGWWQ